MENGLDTFGNNVRERYSLLLTEPYFEQRLKAFDPNLRLTFDQIKKRWTILEKAYDRPGFNVLIVAEDAEGNPKPLGDWVFNKLFVWRKKWEEKARMGADRYWENLVAQSVQQQTEIEDKISEDHQAMLREDITQWKKCSKELQGLPVSDATAGYRKI